MSARRAALRALVPKKQGLVVPGAYDGISALLVQQGGLPAVYMTGYGTAASRRGLPDLDTLLVAVQAMRGFLAEARARDDVRALADRYMPFADFNDPIGVTAQLALAERYRDDERSAT